MAWIDGCMVAFMTVGAVFDIRDHATPRRALQLPAWLLLAGAAGALLIRLAGRAHVTPAGDLLFLVAAATLGWGWARRKVGGGDVQALLTVGAVDAAWLIAAFAGALVWAVVGKIAWRRKFVSFPGLAGYALGMLCLFAWRWVAIREAL